MQRGTRASTHIYVGTRSTTLFDSANQGIPYSNKRTCRHHRRCNSYVPTRPASKRGRCASIGTRCKHWTGGARPSLQSPRADYILFSNPPCSQIISFHHPHSPLPAETIHRHILASKTTQPAPPTQ